MKGHAIIAMVLSVLLLAACGSNTGTIKIGFVGPLTGENSVLGDPLNKGTLLAVEEINAAGGINGKKLELISEDGGCKGDIAAKAGSKLISADKVLAIVGGTCSSEMLAIAPMAEQAKIVLFSPSATNPTITDAGDYIFRSISSDKFQAAVMAEHLINTGIEKTAVIYANSDYNVGLKNAFQQRYEELGGTVVAAETYEQDAKDFRTQLTKIKAADAEALYVIPYAEGGLILKQASELGLKVPYFGPEAMGDKKIIAQAGPAGEGFVYTVPKFDAENPKSKEFIGKFKATYGAEPGFPAYAANGYDEVYLIADAIRSKGESGDAIRDYLYTVKDYDGAGGTLTLDENGDALKDFQLMMVKDGELVPYAEKKEAAPAPAPSPLPNAQPKVEPPSVETVAAPEPKPQPGESQKFIISMKEWDIQPGESYVKPGRVTLQAVNRGSNPHSVAIQDKGKNVIAQTPEIAVGASETVDFTVSAGKYEILADGWLKGMRGLLIVE